MQAQLFDIPSRENIKEKGRRYLVEGRLVVTLLTETSVLAKCRGNGKFYRCGYARGNWWCECPAIKDCAHLEALRLVTVGS